MEALAGSAVVATLVTEAGGTAVALGVGVGTKGVAVMLSGVVGGNLMTGVGSKPQPAKTPASTSNNTAITPARKQQGRGSLSAHLEAAAPLGRSADNFRGNRLSTSIGPRGRSGWCRAMSRAVKKNTS